MATRNENLNRIRNAMGSYSPGTKNITQMNGPRYEETSRDESLRILQSALSGGSTAGTTPQSAVPAASSPYTGEPNTSSGAVAPPSPQGEGLVAHGTGRSAEQIQQEISDSRKRLEQLQLEAAYILTVEPGAGLDRQMDEERARIKALNKELDALKAPSTNAERDSLIQRMNAITENEGYATTVELADAVTQEKQDTRQRLHQLDEELGNAARFYDSGERAGAVVKGALKQTGSAYTNFMGTLQGLGNRLHESSSAADQAVAGSDYAGWATDELTAANMAEAIIKENPDGNYLEGLQKEEQRLYEKADTVAASAAKDIAQAKEGLSALGQAGVDISVAIIQNGIDAVAKKSGLGMLPFFVRAAGGSMQEARHAGASTGQQLAYGLPKAAIEVATEWLSGGIAGTGVSGIDEVIEPLINKLAKSTAGKVALSAVYDAAMEGTEEVLSDLLDPFVKLVYNDQALKEAWENRADVGAQMLYDYLIGAVVGSIGSGTKILTGAATDEVVTGKPVKTGAVTGQYAEKNAALAGSETQAAEQAENSPAQTQAKSYPTVEELIQPIRPAGNAYAEAVAPAAGGNAPVNVGVQARTQGQAAVQQVMAQEEQSQREAEWWANREKEAEKAYEGAKKRYEEALNGGNADETDFFSGPEMLKIFMDAAEKDLEDVRNRKIPSPFSNTEEQAAGTAQEAQRPTPQAETPPATANADQTASDALNMQEETTAQGKETAEEQNAAPAADNQTTGQREQADGADAVRGFSENVATDSAMEAALREDVAANPDLYKRLSNKETLQKAQDIFTQGLDAARSELERAIGAAQSGQKLAPEMVPLSRMVANELTRQGELTAARKIISDVAAELTSAGQLGQAGAILRNADPMTVLNTLQKSIDQINAEMAKKFGKRNQWKAELTAEEIKQISETDFSQDGAYETIQQQIAKRLGREMPATFAEKWRELRKVGMLGNPRTQGKNFFANVPGAVERKVAEGLSGGLQELAVKAGIMAKEEQTRTLRVSQQSKDLAKSVYKNNIDRISRKGNKGELRGVLRDTRTYFNKGILQKALEKATGHQLDDAALDYVRRFAYDMLEKGDAPFVKSAFIDSLAQYCEAQGIKSEADVTETAFNYALDQAMAATFKDASALAKLLNSIKDNAGIAGEALDVLFPFTTTPINIGKEFAKYSPLGLFQLTNAKSMSAAEIIDTISRATTGGAVVYAGYLLRSLGAITGTADDDKDKAAHDRAKGISPYSILGKYSYEWMGHTGAALAMGAAIYDAMEDGGDLTEVLLNGFLAAGDAYLEQSFFNDIIDLFQGYGSPTENLLTELFKSMVSQSVPSVVGAAARTIDPTVRTSYSGGNIIDDILAQAKVKTPGLSKSAPASVNVRGEETKRGNLVQRILDNFIFPWTTNRNGEEKNAVDNALDEVYESTGDKTIFRQVSPYKVDYGGETYKMTGEEREQFQKTQGQVHDDILQQIIDGTLWQKMDNDAKVKTMQFANEYALDAAKRELVESRGDEYSSDWDDEAELPDVGNYLAAKTTLKASQDSKDYSLLDALVDNVSEQQKAVKEKLNKDFSMLDELIYGKQHGVDSKTIYTTKEKADANGNGSVTQEELWNYLETQVIMPSSKKSVLWDILTSGKTGYSEYAEKQK